MEYPKLRHIEAFPTELEGQKLICLRDPENLSDQELFVSEETVYLLSHFDGTLSIADIQNSIKTKFGFVIKTEEIMGLIKQLDDALFLESDKFNKYKIKLEKDFLNSSVREASHAGLSYPDTVDDLNTWFTTFFKNAEESVPFNPSTNRIKGLISPHIDFRRGGNSYALAYRELANESSADTFFIFGTSHYAQVENPFILTKKNFKTPFGVAETDCNIVNELTRHCDWDLFEGEISHRTEHSIEFQVAFLQYIFRNQRDIKIVPILCNSFYKLVKDGISPEQDVQITTFLSKVSKIISNNGDNAFIIAGADMAHVGTKFGDPDPVDDNILAKIKERDHISLSHTEKMDAEGFYRSVEEEKDWRKICGLSPIYALLKTVNAGKGKLLDYDQALEPDTGSVVSYASVAFYS